MARKAGISTTGLPPHLKSGAFRFVEERHDAKAS